LPCRTLREGKWWIAQCDLLDIASQGTARHVAERNLRQAILLFLEGCLRSGSADRVLAQSGFTALWLDGRHYWVAAEGGQAGQGRRSLRFTGYVTAAFPRPSAAPERLVRVPSIPPWMIRADAHGQAHSR
jgi:hypothetical protein